MPDPTRKEVRFVSVPFNFEYSRSRVAVVRELGTHEVPLEIANAALDAGAAVPVHKPAPARKKAAAPAKPKAHAKTTDTTDNAGLGREGLDADGGNLDGSSAADTE